MKRKKCRYYCGGYCFWNGDSGEVCDTSNNAHEGYCSMAESDKELEELALAIIEEEEKKLKKETNE